MTLQQPPWSVLWVALLLVVGCGGPGPSVGPVAACSLVPDMDTLVSLPAIGQPAGYRLNEVDHCTWVYGADPARYVGLSVGPLRAHTGAIDAFGAGESVPGVGDDARWWAANRTLSVGVGQRAVQVNLELGEAEATRDRAVSIATAALANLP